MYLIALLVVFGLFGLFAMQNDSTQTFTLAGYTWSLPIWAPTAVGVGAMSVLLLLHMSQAGLGSRFREVGMGRALDQHRGAIESLRDENARLREELAAARGAASAANPRRSWTDGIRDLTGRASGRRTVT